ncbi:hypothetical protein RirG_176990 [Rhizophagus irregularis DAOM 197198w]|uniref:Amine oxidase n=3 Tax=Rhizophagus irregularis TaxID=588596 RepID=A0A015M1Q0_RHIIW|nr:hypothetical protein RirG_176990 [Rhizophagus irregularis DAOM 197198w]
MPKTGSTYQTFLVLTYNNLKGFSMSSHMFSDVPPGKPSLRAAYEQWLKLQNPVERTEPGNHPKIPPKELNVGIVGGGMSGLYAALILQSHGAKEPNQYFEAGAMRLPETSEQQPVFDLIDYLNEKLPGESCIKTIPYVLYDDKGNLVLINNKMQQDGKSTHIREVIWPYLDALKKDFAKGFQEIIKFDDFSFRAYLVQVAEWDEDRINYVEVMTSQTNQFQNSFTELVIENMDFSQASWKTIENGMERLPHGCAQLIGSENIFTGAEVYKIEDVSDGVNIYHSESSAPVKFDKVLMALPPAALRTIETPTWSPDKMHAIRALHFEPLYKIGLRFKTRFWEKVSPPSKGGQSITDLPSRWFVYPSYGIGDNGPGVLLLYAWMTDAIAFLPKNEKERICLGLRDLKKVYGDQVDIDDQFIEGYSINWTDEESTGDAMFFPGQFRNLFNIARAPEGNVYFAGEHLSVHHTWILGALDSALLACQQMLGEPNIMPLRPTTKQNPPKHDYDYSDCIKAKPMAVYRDQRT